MSNIEAGTSWTLKEEQSVYKVLYVGSTRFSNYVKLDGLFNGWDLISEHDFLSKFKQFETNNSEIEKLISQAVKEERDRFFSLSVNEFLVQKLDYKNENTTIYLSNKKLVDEREMKLMDWVDLGVQGDD